MSNAIADAISITTIHRVLEELLDGYLVEKEESQQDNDTHYTAYWDSACQTVYEVAADLKIPLEEKEKPSKRRLHKQHLHQPDSITPDNADIQLSEGSYPQTRHRCTDSQRKN